VIDGKAMAREIQDEVKADIMQWVSAGNRHPHLTAVLLGTDPASHVYVRNKMKAANYTGKVIIFLELKF